MLAAGLTFVCSGPQLWRSLADVRGVSAAAWVQSWALGAMWAAYGTSSGVWALAFSEGAFAAGSALIVGRLMRPGRAVIVLLSSAALVAAGYLLLPAGVCLVAATVASLIARGSQVRALVVARSAAGVSTATWLLLAAANASWALVGLLRPDAFLAGSAAAICLSSLLVVAAARCLDRR